MISLYLEMILRTFLTIALASWRRLTSDWRKPFRWLLYQFVCAMAVFILLAISPRRGGLFLAIYSWFRPIDDILDGEDPRVFSDIEDIIAFQTKVVEKFARGDLMLSEVVGRDRLLILAQFVVGKVGMKKLLQESVPLIWKLMITDYRWRTLGQVPTRVELLTFAVNQDQVIFKLASVLLGADQKTLDALTCNDLGVFTRTDWLYDLEHDLNMGLVHIPKEALNGCERETIVGRKAKRALQSDLVLRKYLQAEVQDLVPLWGKVQTERPIFESAFPTRVHARLYDRFLVRVFERDINTVRKRYEVV